jgi:hypothetical protein
MCAHQGLINLSDFKMSELLPAFAYRCFVIKAAKENLDLLEREIHISGEPYEQHAVNRFIRITALPARAIRNRNQAKLFVVPNRRRIHARSAGKLSNFHGDLNIYL